MRIAIAGPIALMILAGCSGERSQAQDVHLNQPATAQVSASRQTAITTAVARVAPSVVTVQTQAIERVPVDFFGQFFGGQPGQRATAGARVWVHRAGGRCYRHQCARC